MSRYGAFVELVVEQLALLGRPRVRALFGGYGVYHNGCRFAIIADDRLYFKADALTRADFEAIGSSPFTYVARGKPVTLGYFEAPPEVFEDQEAMRRWADRAYEAARRARDRAARGGQGSAKA
jgi:DNA transformation protein